MYIKNSILMIVYIHIIIYYYIHIYIINIYQCRINNKNGDEIACQTLPIERCSHKKIYSKQFGGLKVRALDEAPRS